MPDSPASPRGLVAARTAEGLVAYVHPAVLEFYPGLKPVKNHQEPDPLPNPVGALPETDEENAR